MFSLDGTCHEIQQLFTFSEKYHFLHVARYRPKDYKNQQLQIVGSLYQKLQLLKVGSNHIEFVPVKQGDVTLARHRLSPCVSKHENESNYLLF